MNRLITGSLIHDSEPITSLLKLIPGSEKQITAGNTVMSCFICFNDIVMMKNVSCNEKNEGLIKFINSFTIAAGFQT
jgi:hypothetical protein